MYVIFELMLGSVLLASYSSFHPGIGAACMYVCRYMCVCVCVCVRDRARCVHESMHACVNDEHISENPCKTRTRTHTQISLWQRKTMLTRLNGRQSFAHACRGGDDLYPVRVCARLGVRHPEFTVKTVAACTRVATSEYCAQGACVRASSVYVQKRALVGSNYVCFTNSLAKAVP